MVEGNRATGKAREEFETKAKAALDALQKYIEALGDLGEQTHESAVMAEEAAISRSTLGTCISLLAEKARVAFDDVEAALLSEFEREGARHG